MATYPDDATAPVAFGVVSTVAYIIQALVEQTLIWKYC